MDRLQLNWTGTVTDDTSRRYPGSSLVVTEDGHAVLRSRHGQPIRERTDATAVSGDGKSRVVSFADGTAWTIRKAGGG